LSKIRPDGDVELRKASSPSSVAESSSSGPRIKIEADTDDLAREFDGLNVENDGRVSFHGPTSLFQLPSGVGSDTASKSHYAQEIEGRKERLINSAWRERAFEQMAAMPVSFWSWGWSEKPHVLTLCDLQEPFQYLLDSHWCWIQPLWNFVYRPAFTRLFYLVPDRDNEANVRSR
jgi:hypothetical protein